MGKMHLCATKLTAGGGEEEEERGANTHSAVILQQNSLQASMRTQDGGEQKKSPNGSNIWVFFFN